MPLQRAEGPVYVPYSKRDPSQIKKPEVRTKSALQQNVQQKDSPQNATDPSTDPKKASSKEVKRAKHADAKQLGAKKKKPGEEVRSAPPWSLAGFTIAPEEIARFEANPESLKTYGGLCMGSASR